jgi:hypothetical protein
MILDLGFLASDGYLCLPMKDVEIRQRLHHYIETDQTKKVKAIYSMAEDEIQETNDYWKDEEFLAELEQREEDFRLGKSTSYASEEALKKTLW